MKREIITIIVVVLFFGLALAPSINANVSKQDDLVELDVEFCGIGKKHTVKLTQEEYEEVEQLFDEIKDRLSNDNANEIFKDAIIKLDKYGLLGGLSVKQAQRLVTSPYQRFNDNRLFQKIVNAEELGDMENSFCSISAQLTYVNFFRPQFRFMLILLSNINPLQFFSSASIGYYTWYSAGPNEPYPSTGHIWTNGTNGYKQWEGSFKGDIDEIHTSLPPGLMGNVFFQGIKGFSGIQVTVNRTTDFFGFARQVKIRNYW